MQAHTMAVWCSCLAVLSPQRGTGQEGARRVVGKRTETCRVLARGSFSLAQGQVDTTFGVRKGFHAMVRWIGTGGEVAFSVIGGTVSAWDLLSKY